MPTDDETPLVPEAGASSEKGITRRGFLGALGASTLGTAVAPGALVPPAPQTIAADQRAPLVLTINGSRYEVAAEPRWSLLYVLRDVLGLTGTKPGCERGECGACTVLVDGRPRPSCMILAVEAAGMKIETIEGVAQQVPTSAVVEQFVAQDALQCGYCTPGQVMAATGLLRANPRPSAAEIRAGMSGNLCRCGAYPHIHLAVARAAERLKGGKP
jgi:xanthine dehydrogenase YagT iron-sulfur-binding subunit